MSNANPSLDPANDGTIVGMMRQVMGKFLQGVDDMIPAKVIAFDRLTNRAQVQPLIQMVTTSGELVSRAFVASVPVFQYSGGGFVINFPLNSGDYGWLKANDRDISLFLQGWNETQPNTDRKHSFSDAVFFPDTMRGWDISEAGLVIQSMDGSQCISIQDNIIKIKSSTQVIIDAPDANFTGNITAQGEITTELRGGIDLSDHIHTGVQTGGGNTGLPI